MGARPSLPERVAHGVCGDPGVAGKPDGCRVVSSRVWCPRGGPLTSCKENADRGSVRVATHPLALRLSVAWISVASSHLAAGPRARPGVSRTTASRRLRKGHFLGARSLKTGWGTRSRPRPLCRSVALTSSCPRGFRAELFPASAPHTARWNRPGARSSGSEICCHTTQCHEDVTPSSRVRPLLWQ